ncbi:MAG: BMP family ABC transporter substrate-binding protein, partial [Clostridia bacterium]|nr:BMP family ABC transporter substrate-binding protein [Clostridia bacterium]
MLVSVGTLIVSCGPEAQKGGVADSILPAPAIAAFSVPENFKIGIILLHDEDSTYDLNFINAVLAVKKAFNMTDEQVIIARNIPEGNECYEKASELVSKGCKVIFADSFGHETYMLNAAREFPDVQFCHATGTMAHTAGVANYHNAFAAIYEGRYLAGVAAGMKLNEIKAAGKLKGDVPKMGYVGAFTYAEVISGLTSFYLGAKSVCPDVVMDVQFTGSWYDENEEKSAAQSLI